MKLVGLTWGMFFAISLRILLAGVFLFSAFGKVSSPEGFLTFVNALHFLHFVPPTIFLWLVVLAEVAIGFFVLIPVTAKVGGVAAFVLLGLFTSVLIVSSLKDIDVTCGCFGGMVQESSVDVSILRNIILLVFAAFVSTGSKYSVSKV